jgi:hypothetical protein
MQNLLRVAATTVLTTASALTGATAASAADGEDYFVVDTQFFFGPADVVDAGGAFADCRMVKDLGAATSTTTTGDTQYEGEKRITCAPGTKVTVHYVVILDEAAQRTEGTWWIVDSTLPGATTGGGTLVGDYSACTPMRNAGGCILDTFSGDVS